MKIWGRIAFAVLLCYLVGLNPVRVLGQAGAGYTQLNSSPVTSLTYTDATVADGSVYQYEVIAVQTVGGVQVVSTPAVSPGAQIPGTGTHSVTLTWTVSTTPNVTYNVYRTGAITTNPPGAVSLSVN